MNVPIGRAANTRFHLMSVRSLISCPPYSWAAMA